MELLDEAPELEAIPSQTGSGKEAGEAEDGGDWFYSLENYETDGHPHSATILQHRRANPKVIDQFSHRFIFNLLFIQFFEFILFYFFYWTLHSQFPNNKMVAKYTYYLP